jgi:hypothetical protein
MIYWYGSSKNCDPFFAIPGGGGGIRVNILGLGASLPLSEPTWGVNFQLVVKPFTVGEGLPPDPYRTLSGCWCLGAGKEFTTHEKDSQTEPSSFPLSTYSHIHKHLWIILQLCRVLRDPNNVKLENVNNAADFTNRVSITFETCHYPPRTTFHCPHPPISPPR